MIKVDIDVSGLGLSIDQITATLADKEALHIAAAAGVELAWKNHLEANYLPRDDDGVDYWADVMNSLESTASDAAGTVRVHEQFLELYYYGGTVTPGKSISWVTGKPTRALAIPSSRVPGVDGRKAPTLHYHNNIAPLAFIKATEGNIIGYLFEGMEDGKISRGKNKGKARIRRAGPLVYTLMSSYTYRPDPRIIPPEEDLKQAATGALLDFITAGL